MKQIIFNGDTAKSRTVCGKIGEFSPFIYVDDRSCTEGIGYTLTEGLETFVAYSQAAEPEILAQQLWTAMRLLDAAPAITRDTLRDCLRAAAGNRDAIRHIAGDAESLILTTKYNGSAAGTKEKFLEKAERILQEKIPDTIRQTIDDALRLHYGEHADLRPRAWDDPTHDNEWF